MKALETFALPKLYHFPDFSSLTKSELRSDTPFKEKSTKKSLDTCSLLFILKL